MTAFGSDRDIRDQNLCVAVLGIVTGADTAMATLCAILVVSIDGQY